MSGVDAAMLRRTILTFAEALAVTPPDQLARVQPVSYGRRKPSPRLARDVLIDGITAAGDLLLMLETDAGGSARPADVDTSVALSVSRS